MKPFEIPMILASLFGLCLFPGLDNPVVLADFTFGAPANTQTDLPFIDANHDVIDCFSADGLEMYITSFRPEGYGDGDLYVLKRASKDESWGPRENLGPAVNGPKQDSGASISADGLTLYFNSDRSGGYGSFDNYATTRATKASPWGSPLNLGPTVNSSADDVFPCISANGLELYLGSYRNGGQGRSDIYVARRATTNGAWETPVNLGPTVNGPASEHWIALSPDGLWLLFSDHQNPSAVRPGGYGGADIWMTRRASLSASWQTPVNLGPMVNGPRIDCAPRMSPDGSTLYFATTMGVGTGTWEYWQAPIIPVVDFNGDGKVDGKEVLDIVEHFGQNDSLYDIGPSALGDGVVDADDLIVLADYIGAEWDDPTLLAHWEFEEGAGSVTMDWVGGHDAVIVGETLWEPNGQVGGALAFDGKQNLVRTVSPVLNPGLGPFSAIAWVKGGATNRVIVSQVSGADWLYVNSLGMLATDLKGPDASGRPLTSAAYVLDDQWHRVALVWDGVSRSLYMDGVEIAEDVQPGLVASNGNLQMGCGSSAASATFWSGLIDDVRIYNRVVRP